MPLSIQFEVDSNQFGVVHAYSYDIWGKTKVPGNEDMLLWDTRKAH